MMYSLPKFDGNRKNGRPGRALIVEGGGMRGAFAGGALGMMGELYPPENYDIVIGVSSGACSASYYVTEKNIDTARRNKILQVWRYELAGSKLMSYRNLLRGRPFLNQEYLIDELFGRRYPVKREILDEKSTTPFYIVVSNIKTLQPEYHRARGDNLFNLLKAATSLPIATKGRRRIGETEYTDGGVLDPLPVQAAIDAGYTDLTVILTNPRTHEQGRIGPFLSFMCFPWDGQVQRKLTKEMHVLHQRSYNLINNPPPGVRVRIIDPRHTLPAHMLSTNVFLLHHTVEMGLAAAFELFGKEKRRKGFLARIRRWFGFRPSTA